MFYSLKWRSNKEVVGKTVHISCHRRIYIFRFGQVEDPPFGPAAYYLEAYGTIDELSSNLGMLISDTACVAEVRDELHRCGFRPSGQNKCPYFRGLLVERVNPLLEALYLLSANKRGPTNRSKTSGPTTPAKTTSSSTRKNIKKIF